MSAWAIVASVAVPAMLALWLMARSGRYARLFAPAHLAELAARAHDISRPDAPPLRTAGGEVMPPAAVTSAGLSVVYTRETDGRVVVHHLSLAHRSGALARAAGLSLVALVLEALGVDLAAVDVSVSRRLTTHATFRLSASEQRDFDTRPPPAIDEASARAALGRALAQRDRWIAAGRLSPPAGAGAPPGQGGEQ